MILHLSRMRRKVNREVYNDRKNVSATTEPERNTECGDVVFSVVSYPTVHIVVQEYKCILYVEIRCNVIVP